MNTLSNLGFEMNQEDGFSVSNDSTSDSLEQFNETEIRLIVFALKTNLLGKIFPFEEMADRIEKHIISEKE